MNETPQDPTALVASGYDQIADKYFAHYRKNIPGFVADYVNKFNKSLPPRSSVLELGCGNGLPFTALLAKSYDVTGIDISTTQIEYAKKNVPNATFIQTDMTTHAFPQNTFDGIIALYSIIHVPRERHAELFDSIATWLKPGGVFTASLGSSDSEKWIDENWHGAPMYWSHFGPETNRNLIEKSGLKIQSDTIEEFVNPEDGEEERHHWVVARKPPIQTELD